MRSSVLKENTYCEEKFDTILRYCARTYVSTFFSYSLVSAVRHLFSEMACQKNEMTIGLSVCALWFLFGHQK